MRKRSSLSFRAKSHRRWLSGLQMSVLGGHADWIWTHAAGGKLFLGSQHSAVHLSELQALGMANSGTCPTSS